MFEGIFGDNIRDAIKTFRRGKIMCDNPTVLSKCVSCQKTECIHNPSHPCKNYQPEPFVPYQPWSPVSQPWPLHPTIIWIGDPPNTCGTGGTTSTLKYALN
jgi:hypothetical protein